MADCRIVNTPTYNTESIFNNCYSDVLNWDYAERVLRYLKKTKGYCLKYSKQKSNLEGFMDADWASNIIDSIGSPINGYTFVKSGASICWEVHNRKQ